MKKLKALSILSLVAMLLVTGCEPLEPQDPYFGMSKATWESLTPEQQSRVMDEHYKKQTAESEKQHELEVQKEKNRPYEAGLDLIQSLTNKKSQSKGFKITEIKKKFHNYTLTLENGDSFELSPFKLFSVDHWSRGQRVEVSKSSEMLYPVSLKNLATGDSVDAKRVK